MAAAAPRSRSGGRGRRLVNEINVVPYIDVMLVLLVIFMVTAPLLPPGAIDLPRAGRSSTRPDQYIEVQVRAADDMRVRGINTGDPSERRVARGDLAGAIEQLRGDNAQMAVVISGDRAVRYEAIIDVMSELQRLNVGRVALMVKPAN
ncbi:MAG TPA: biopolymer transporter ExbD [Burkholderiaceae bacterium]|jgi:biopolymer transport protein TolR|nr:biopolymer transporter ExbD [Burkholderiaceae bacterium]HRA78722.1 biopolymer transporter ExbD [Burkholderiaceae bacterium]